MRVALFHNYYRQAGGEDVVFSQEESLLSTRGHDVRQFTVRNDGIEERRLAGRIRAGASTVWSRQSYQEVRRWLGEVSPQIAHFHNTFPILSPAAYYAADSMGVPVVQTLHNYRLICPAATFYRNGVCVDCAGQTLPWPAVIHACYRSNRLATVALSGMLTVHRLLGTWNEKVDLYIALTEFARERFIENGLPPERVVVKPNFLVRDPGVGAHDGEFVLFVGRLAPEKGIETLLQAWETIGKRVPLKVVGDGPLAEAFRSRSAQLQGVDFLGPRSKGEVLALMKSARALIFPSTWYEGFPMVLLEAFASGLPVIASNLGSMASIVEDGRTGLHFRPGDADHLADKVLQLTQNPTALTNIGAEARAEYRAHYTAEKNYTQLMFLYEQAARRARERA